VMPFATGGMGAGTGQGGQGGSAGDQVAARRAQDGCGGSRSGKAIHAGMSG